MLKWVGQTQPVRHYSIPDANTALLRNLVPYWSPDGLPESAPEGSFWSIVWKPLVQEGLGFRAAQPSILAVPGDHKFKAECQEDGGLGYSHRTECDENDESWRQLASFSLGTIFGWMLTHFWETQLIVVFPVYPSCYQWGIGEPFDGGKGSSLCSWSLISLHGANQAVWRSDVWLWLSLWHQAPANWWESNL